MIDIKDRQANHNSHPTAEASTYRRTSPKTLPVVSVSAGVLWTLM
jgi:hypothetical protein